MLLNFSMTFGWRLLCLKVAIGGRETSKPPSWITFLAPFQPWTTFIWLQMFQNKQWFENGSSSSWWKQELRVGPRKFPVTWVCSSWKWRQVSVPFCYTSGNQYVALIWDEAYTISMLWSMMYLGQRILGRYIPHRRGYLTLTLPTLIHFQSGGIFFWWQPN